MRICPFVEEHRDHSSWNSIVLKSDYLSERFERGSCLKTVRNMSGYWLCNNRWISSMELYLMRTVTWYRIQTTDNRVVSRSIYRRYVFFFLTSILWWIYQCDNEHENILSRMNWSDWWTKIVKKMFGINWQSSFA